MIKGLLVWLCMGTGLFLVGNSLFYGGDIRQLFLSPVFFVAAIIFAVSKGEKGEKG